MMTLRTYTLRITTSDYGLRKIIDWIKKHEYGVLSQTKIEIDK